MYYLRSVWTSLKNLVNWGRVVWQYRWWDYGFSLAMIVRDLELKEKEWGKNTHYVGDKYTKKRIQVLLRMYKRYEDTSCYKQEDKLLKKFLRLYARNLERLWD